MRATHSFDALQENNRKQLRELIEEMAAKKAEPGSLEQKIGGLYRLAMDKGAPQCRRLRAYQGTLGRGGGHRLAP